MNQESAKTYIQHYDKNHWNVKSDDRWLNLAVRDSFKWRLSFYNNEIVHSHEHIFICKMGNNDQDELI